MKTRKDPSEKSDEPGEASRISNLGSSPSQTEPSQPFPDGDLIRRLNQMQVYQIELELQNEELRRANLTSLEREKLPELFFQHAPPAIAMLDKEMRYLHASSRWIEDFHLDAGDLVGLSHYEVFPEVPKRWKEIHQRCLAGATERCEADLFPRKDGNADWVKWEIRPWAEASGEIGGIFILSELLADQKGAEIRLRELGENYRTLFRFASEGIFTLSPDGAVIEANQVAASMHGYTIVEM